MRILKTILELAKWRKQKFQPPVPYEVKVKTLERFNLPEATWVETGTFHGTTALFLSKIAKRVYTIEASEELYLEAQKKLNNNPSIVSIFGRSQEKMSEILPNLSGNVCFWLDAHYCGSKTYNQDSRCPLLLELEIILRDLPRLKHVNILIDDIRDFTTGRDDYPDKTEVIQAARPFLTNWEIINDILVLQRIVR